MREHDLGILINTATEASLEAGELILKNLGGLSSSDIVNKQASDYVTRTDKESESLITGIIKARFPDHSITAEESAEEDGSEYRWIIDPLDGTTNFIHGYPVFSVSIAVEHRGNVVAGSVYDPTRKELFKAIKGGGAFLNEEGISVSGIIDLERSLIATGFPFRRKDLIDSYLWVFRSLFSGVSDIRRAGSAALDLSYLACGRCDGFFEIGLSIWDIAAGGLLVSEAGGIVSDFGGGHDHLITGNVVAGTASTYSFILDAVRSTFEGTIDR